MMSSKKYFIFLVFIILISFYSSNACANYKNDSPECLMGVSSDKFAASFSIKNPNQKTWTWNMKGFYSDGTDYSWTVEPGFLKNNKFKPDEYAFGLASTNDHDSQGKKSGSIEDMIKQNSYGSVYLNDQDKNKRFEADEKNGYPQVRASRYKDTIILYSNSHANLTMLFAHHPTDARMTVKTPYPDQSYTCMTKIYYDK